MNTRRIVGAVALALVAATSTQAAQGASLPEKYRHRYDAVADRHGARAPGRDILRDGVRFMWVSADHARRHAATRPASSHELAVSARQLRAILRPVNPLLHRTAVPPGHAPAGVRTASVSAGGVLDAIAACESGGNPAAVDPTGTYRGKYQFDAQTWGSVGGSGDPAAAPEAEQDRRAAALYAQRGAAPWPVCGR